MMKTYGYKFNELMKEYYLVIIELYWNDIKEMEKFIPEVKSLEATQRIEGW